MKVEYNAESDILYLRKTRSKDSIDLDMEKEESSESKSGRLEST